MQRMLIEQVCDLLCNLPFIVHYFDTSLAKAASAAFYDGEWSKLGGYQRGRLMHKLADLIEEHREELARLEGICHSSCHISILNIRSLTSYHL